MSAVEEYRNNPWGMSAARRDGVGSGGYVSFTPKILADAAIAELEAETKGISLDLRSADIAVHEAAVALEVCDTQIARLKVCGNCDEWHPSSRRCYMGDDGTLITDRMDSCHLDPSHWAERNTR